MYPDILVGIKAAHYWGGFTQVDLAVEPGKKAGVPVMVDFGEHNPPNSIEELFMEHLRPGDIFTHAYSNGPKERETIVDENGKLKPLVLKANKGALFLIWAMAVAHLLGWRLFPLRNKVLGQIWSVRICIQRA